MPSCATKNSSPATKGHGSLVAPFAGEHGWYWLNISEKPVTIKLTFTGYHKEVKNYGLIQ